VTRDPAVDEALDNPVWAALTGPQAHLGIRRGSAARYDTALSRFAGLGDADPGAWTDAARLADGRRIVVIAPLSEPPEDWRVDESLQAVQMVAPALDGQPDPEAVPLGPPEAEEMLALVRRTRPGPFLARTVEFGGYLGVRREGALVAMAGERMRVPGWTEVSAVCTDESVRGAGLASRLVRAVVSNIVERGDRAMLHVASTNESAIRLYKALGFLERRVIDIVVASPPGPRVP